MALGHDRLERGPETLGDCAKVNGREGRGDGRCLAAREVHEVSDRVLEPVNMVGDGLEQAGPHGGVFGRAVVEGLRGHADSGDGRAELVAGVGDKVLLHLHALRELGDVAEQQQHAEDAVSPRGGERLGGDLEGARAVFGGHGDARGGRLTGLGAGVNGEDFGAREEAADGPTGERSARCAVAVR